MGRLYEIDFQKIFNFIFNLEYNTRLKPTSRLPKRLKPLFYREPMFYDTSAESWHLVVAPSKTILISPEQIDQLLLMLRRES